MTTRTQRRAYRTRNKIRAVSDRPRLSIFRSAKHIYAQVIDDKSGTTVAAASSANLLAASGEGKPQGNKSELATLVGKAIAAAALAKGVKQVVFDRGSFIYHGRVKALAEAAREGGLDF
jgi:large subunit ribosomal protein L18